MDQGPCYRLWGPHIDEDAFWSTTAPEETDANMRYLDPTYKHPEALDVWSVGCLVRSFPLQVSNARSRSFAGL